MVRARGNRRGALLAAAAIAGCARAVSDSSDLPPGLSAGDASRDAVTDVAVGSRDSGYGNSGDDASQSADAWTGGGNVPDTSIPSPDSAVPPSGACAGKTHIVTTADLLIFDFEGGSAQGWYAYGASGSVPGPVIGAPGAVGTQHAGRLAASGLTAFGAGMGFGTGCWDTSALDGISFWAKGTAGSDNRIQFQVAIPATHAVADGGDCTTKCYDHPSKQLVLTGDWAQYVVPFTDLAQAGFGTPAHYTGIIMALNWVSVDASAVDFWVDEIALYKGAAQGGAVGHGANAPVDASTSD